jgi:hypothetical protein
MSLPRATRLYVQIETCNLLNRASFNIPGFILGADDFGVISIAHRATWRARFVF